jgi:hypothetical protein
MNNKKSILGKILICAALAIGTTGVYAVERCTSKTYCIPGGCSVVTLCYTVPEIVRPDLP